MNNEITYILKSVSPNDKYVMIHPKEQPDDIEVIPKVHFAKEFILLEGLEYKKRPR